MGPADFEKARDGVLAALIAWAGQESAVQALWLQGSLARGDADALSDIDANVAVEDAAFDGLFGARASILQRLAPVLAWSDATTPGFKAVHALLAGGVRLDLAFEPASSAAATPRPVVRALVDKTGLAERLTTTWTAPAGVIGHILGVIVRMTRQGGTWPLRLAHRGQWSTFAMMELDLINAQVAQLMALQIDPALFYQNPFALSRRLPEARRAELDRLTDAALAAIAARDLAAILAAHLDVFDALVREAKAACSSLGVAYPIEAEGDAGIRQLLIDGWPRG